MSSLRIAVVAEGETDHVVIEAALRAILQPSEPIVSQLQPEPRGQTEQKPDHGNGKERGWCGVYRWCRQHRRCDGGDLEESPLLLARKPDVIVLHLDADVAEKGYADCSDAIAAEAANLGTLPCVDPCPPPCPPVQPIADAVAEVLCSWLSPTVTGRRTVVCIPSKAIESWIVAALPDGCGIRVPGDIECEPEIANRLRGLPTEWKIPRKRTIHYRKHASRITSEWSVICERCSQARRFHNDLLSAIQWVPRSQ